MFTLHDCVLATKVLDCSLIQKYSRLSFHVVVVFTSGGEVVNYAVCYVVLYSIITAKLVKVLENMN